MNGAPSNPALQPGRSRRQGVITLEFILAMPLLFIMTLAVFEFAMLALVQQAATTAVIEGAREGAKIFPGFPPFPFTDPGGEPSPDPTDLDDRADYIADVVDTYLGVHCLEVAPAGGAGDDPTRANARVVIERRVGAGAVQTVTRGDDTIDCNATGPPLNPNEIRVTVCFLLVDATDPSGCGNPVPDWLAPFGFSFDGCRFEMSSRANLE